ncbi:glycosyltransferase family 4 protein [Mariprofundus erugo]|uniref:Glycosyltransferase family 4 protein n=1 Tax=Mariprofundus erugo TaxID=2528639 RepID=A0A5R9GQR8_9PROT|nr:glycosyltransferase family 4 protein [Mariprofundus erugo]TLS66743.1 glycosyltransferase family 4 protein [Mariprofundus erugo]
MSVDYGIMKLLICIYKDDERAGGSVRVAEVLIRSMRKSGVDVHLAVAYGGGGRLQRLVGNNCHFLHASGPRDIPAWFAYRSLVRIINPDIIHYIDDVAWMILGGIGITRKRIMHQHFRPNIGVDGDKRLKRIRLLCGTADKVVAISHGAAKQLIEKCQVRPDKVEVVHNAVNFDYLCLPPPMASSDKCVLGMAVRVVEDKGVEDALNLLGLLPQRYELAIAGDGPARTALRLRAFELGVGDRVRWLGSVEDISGFYAKIDFYLFMSWYEGFGLSVAEAMACGKPVVGLLGDGEISEAEYPLVTVDNSVLVERSEPTSFSLEQSWEVFVALRDAILQLESDVTQQEKQAKAAFNWVNERFSSEVFSQKMLEVYRHALSI